jgi:peptidoglycan hydrolase-like protein with peptidoglycan-binding domain
LSAAKFLDLTKVDLGFFCDSTADALTNFQQLRGLPADGVCDVNTWTLLVESSWLLGSRLLYLTSPQLRGDDVELLQTTLAKLGFHQSESSWCSATGNLSACEIALEGKPSTAKAC